jgi:hypothetical protein
MDIDQLAEQNFVFEKTDKTPFQRRARLLQSLWRTEQGYKCGSHKSRDKIRPLGSRLTMPWAEESLANFVTDKIRDVVRSEVLNPEGSKGKLYGRPRIFNDLLSSQPLCFNLFGELKHNLSLASKLVKEFTGGRFTEVHTVKFEYSPSRGDPSYTNDRSAFDVLP